MPPLDHQWLDQIIHGDCLEIMRQLPDGCIPLTVTSPPYDAMRAFGGHPFDFKGIAEQLLRVTMPGGVVVWIVRDQIVNGSETGTSARQKLFFLDLGFNVHQTIIMAKSGNVSSVTTRYGAAPELVFVLSKGKPRYVNLIRDRQNRCAGDTYRPRHRCPDGSMRKGQKYTTPGWGVRFSVWTYTTGCWHTTKDRFAFGHPAMMHESLAEDLIISFCRPGDMVFDPMAGAATTCKMAMLNHRRYLGVEIHEPYWRLARERMEKARQTYRQRLDDWMAMATKPSGTPR